MKLNYSMLPESVIDTFKQSNEPLTGGQELLLTTILVKAQQDIFKYGIDNIIGKT